MTEAEEIAKGLTEAQRKMVLASEPGGWGRSDTAIGVPLRGLQFRTARSLEKMRLGEYSFGSCFEDLYFNNQLGLSVRAVLQEKG